MTKRKLGNSGLEIAPLVFGGNVFGWTADEGTSFRLLDAFVDARFNCIDTADAYSKWVPGNHGGESETILGKWLKKSGKRDDVIVATKVGLEMGPGRKGLARQYIVEEVEESLRRLQTDYIDLYQSHTDDAETPIEETLSAYQTLIQQGKVRAIGASNYSADRLTHALDVSKKNGLPQYETLQPLYNLCDREDYEAQLQSVCEQNGLGVIPYFSLASGFLTGKYRSLTDATDRSRGQMVAKYMNERGQVILKALDSVALDYNATPTKIAIAWLLARPTVTAPIASATSTEQLKDLLDAVDITLDEDAVRTLDEASSWRLEAASA